MQPRPRAETVSGAVVPRVLVPMDSVMPPSQTLRVHSKSNPRALEVVAVDPDLAVDGAEMVLDLGELVEHQATVVAQQLQPLLLVAGPGAHQVGVTAHVADRHPGG